MGDALTIRFLLISLYSWFNLWSSRMLVSISKVYPLMSIREVLSLVSFCSDVLVLNPLGVEQISSESFSISSTSLSAFYIIII